MRQRNIKKSRTREKAEAPIPDGSFSFPGVLPTETFTKQNTHTPSAFEVAPPEMWAKFLKEGIF